MLLHTCSSCRLLYNADWDRQDNLCPRCASGDDSMCNCCGISQDRTEMIAATAKDVLDNPGNDKWLDALREALKEKSEEKSDIETVSKHCDMCGYDAKLTVFCGTKPKFCPVCGEDYYP